MLAPGNPSHLVHPCFRCWECCSLLLVQIGASVLVICLAGCSYVCLSLLNLYLPPISNICCLWEVSRREIAACLGKDFKKGGCCWLCSTWDRQSLGVLCPNHKLWQKAMSVRRRKRSYVLLPCGSERLHGFPKWNSHNDLALFGLLGRDDGDRHGDDDHVCVCVCVCVYCGQNGSGLTTCYCYLTNTSLPSGWVWTMGCHSAEKVRNLCFSLQLHVCYAIDILSVSSVQHTHYA